MENGWLGMRQGMPPVIRAVAEVVVPAPASTSTSPVLLLASMWLRDKYDAALSFVADFVWALLEWTARWITSRSLGEIIRQLFDRLISNLRR
jgi:hypothetical protein